MDLTTNVDSKDRKAILPGIFVKQTVDDLGNITASISYEVSNYTCCVCTEKIIGQIMVCENAHPLCQSCMWGMQTTNKPDACPLCRVVGRGRMIILEKMLLDLIHQCPNTSNGCSYNGYKENINEHVKGCKHMEIKCMWCDKRTSINDLKFHLMTECVTPYLNMSCSDNIDFIKSDEIKDGIVFITSKYDPSIELYIKKDSKTCEIICIQDGSNDERYVEISYDTGLIKREIVQVPIHVLSHMIEEKYMLTQYTIQKLKTYENIAICWCR